MDPRMTHAIILPCRWVAEDRTLGVAAVWQPAKDGWQPARTRLVSVS